MTDTMPDLTVGSRELDFYIWSVLLGNGAMPTTDVIYSARDNDGNPVDMEPVTEDDWSEIPAYSTDRAAAFELAWSFKDSSIKITTDWSDETVCVEIPDGQGSIFDGPWEDFPLLVCRAAIAAKGGQE